MHHHLLLLILAAAAIAVNGQNCRPRFCSDNPNVGKKPKPPRPYNHNYAEESFERMPLPDNAQHFPPPNQPHFRLESLSISNSTSTSSSSSSSCPHPPPPPPPPPHHHHHHHHHRNHTHHAHQHHHHSHSHQGHHHGHHHHGHHHRNHTHHHHHHHALKHHSEHGHPHHNHHGHYNPNGAPRNVSFSLDSSFEAIRMLSNVGFYKFYYGKTGSLSWQNFLFKLDQPAFFTLVDCYCPGDQFDILDHGRLVQQVNYCQPPPPGPCSNPIKDPEECLFSPEGMFCTGGVTLLPGHHNVTIGVTKSAYTAGAGFVRLDSLCVDEETGQTILCCVQEENCNFEIYSD